MDTCCVRLSEWKDLDYFWNTDFEVKVYTHSSLTEFTCTNVYEEKKMWFCRVDDGSDMKKHQNPEPRPITLKYYTDNCLMHQGLLRSTSEILLFSN